MNRYVLVGNLAIAFSALMPVRRTSPQHVPTYRPGLLARFAQPVTTISGALPARLNYVKFAESHRPMSDIIEGGSQERYVSARTAFQVVYPSGTVMIDAGMDETVHKFFGFGREEP